MNLSRPRAEREKPLIISVFLPHLGCPKRCVFCNQTATASEIPSPSAVREFIEKGLGGFRDSQAGKPKQVAFYGGSFTAINREEQVRYLAAVQPFLSSGAIDSIRISTRPDVLSDENLALLGAYGVRTVEIGAQSMIDDVLCRSHRGHTAEDTAAACLSLKRHGFEVGLHLMIGLPGDTLDYFLRSLDQVISLGPHFVRIHPTLVLRGAPLEALWREGKYLPLSLEEAVQWLKYGFLRMERSSIALARIGLQPTVDLEDHLLAGPYHPALRQLVDSAIFLDMAANALDTYPHERETVFFLCNPEDISNARGQKNLNMVQLRKRFGLREIHISGREGLPRHSLVFRHEAGEFLSNRASLLRNDRKG